MRMLSIDYWLWRTVSSSFFFVCFKHMQVRLYSDSVCYFVAKPPITLMSTMCIDTIPRVEKVSTGETVQLSNSNDYYALGGDSIKIYCYCIPEKYVHFLCIWH